MYLARYCISHVLDFHAPRPRPTSPPLPIRYPSSPSSADAVGHRRPSQPARSDPSHSRRLLATRTPGSTYRLLTEKSKESRAALRCTLLLYSHLFGTYSLSSPQTIPVLLQSLSPAVGYSHLPYTPSYEVRGFYSLYIYLGGGWGYINGGV